MKNKFTRAINPEHFEFILDNIGGYRYQRSRARVAHTLLRVFGFRISNLKTVTSEQLSNLKNKQTFRILSTSVKEEGFLVFFHVDEMKIFIDPILPDIEILQEKAEINRIKYSLGPNESEFWSTKIITRVQLTKSINDQLKPACAKYNVRFTSHSYRRGIARKGRLATVLPHISGYKAPKEYLNMSDIKQEIEAMKNLIDMPKLIKDNQSFEEIEKVVNSLLNKELAEDVESSDSNIN